MVNQPYMSAKEAATRLGISRATLYAYVSRGLIRSEPAGDDSRRHRYITADVETLYRRRRQQRNPAAAAEGALDWGMPVLDSAITLISAGHLYYRGHDAALLAQEAGLEEVAGLIWTGRLAGNLFRQAPPPMPEIGTPLKKLDLTEQLQAILPLAAAADPAAYDLRPEGIMASGVRILHLLVHVLAGRPTSSKGIAGALQEGWQLLPDTRDLLNAALVLCADHELNVSAFTARCIASAAATPYAVVQGGLAALQGIRHGGHTERVAALFQEVGNPAAAHAVLAARLRRGESLPGFGHPLYPDGDPRAQALLQMVEMDFSRSPALELAKAVIAAADNLLGVQPNIDFGLVTLARALALPPGSPLALFALGRTVGWIGHALEQYALGTLIRPRARYVGEWPD